MENLNNSRENIFSANDALDINELASLNDDISPEFIEQLQSKLEQNANAFTGKQDESFGKDDSELFEEIIEEAPAENINDNPTNFEDPFLKKYNAKKNGINPNTPITEESSAPTVIEENPIVNEEPAPSEVANKDTNEEIKILTSGNIIEKPFDKKQAEYNESLNYIDNNTKYSKYVIYIDPENKDFIESLTVKERKNLINKILREQDDIAITKRRLGIAQTIIKHSLIAIITLSISIPLVYFTINSCLEASINNYRQSKTIFKTLYKEKGKVKANIYKTN